jgi:hypothetical protein
MLGKVETFADHLNHKRLVKIDNRILDMGYKQLKGCPFGGSAPPFTGYPCARLGFDQQLCQCLSGVPPNAAAHVK